MHSIRGFQRTRSGRRLSGFMLLVLLSVALSACSNWGARTWLKAPGWSRGEAVASTWITEPSPLVVAQDGSLFLLTVTSEEGTFRPTLTNLTQRGEVEWQRAFEALPVKPHGLGMIQEGEELRIFWIVSGDLYTKRVTLTGGALESAMRMDLGVEVGSYAAALDNRGRLALLAAGTRSEPGIFAFPPGELAGEPSLVDPLGTRPRLMRDRDGVLHALWVHYPRGFGQTEILYARSSDGDLREAAPVKLHSMALGTGRVLRGPELGIDGDDVIVIWMLEVRTGMEAGEMEAAYFSFPRTGEVPPVQATSLWIPTTYDLSYVKTAETELRAEARVSLEGGRFPATMRILSASFAPGLGGETAAATNVKVDYLRRKTRWQIGVVYFRSGRAVDYQLLTFTPGETRSPFLTNDARGDLYLTWMEHGAGESWPVFFASTSPDIVEALTPLSAADWGQMALETVFGMLSGVVLLPMGFVWLVAAIIVLLATSFLRREEDPLNAPGTIVSLLLALAAYWTAKFFVLPGIGTYVPFSAWIPILPASWRAPLLYGIPVVITVLGLWVAFRETYGQDRRSPLFFILIYGIVDGVLSLALYGVLIWGAV